MKHKQIVLALVFLASFLFVHATESQLTRIPAGGETIPMAQDRESYFSHHGLTHDYSLYGANKWAVRFNFRSAYPNVSSCSFSIKKARIHFPNIGDSVTVSLYSEVNSLPSQLITSARVAVNNNLLDITFPQIVQAEVVWLLVDYVTNMSNRYVAASEGGGTNSYYWNTNAINPYFQSLATAGFNCELRFGLVGDFNLNTPDLQLVSFDLAGTLRPRNTAKPVFSIYNHSNQAVTGAQIELAVTAPDGAGYSHNQTITITDTILPQSLFEAVAPGYQNYSFDLPPSGMQISVQATLSSTLAESDTTLANNMISKNYAIFAYGYPLIPVENFARYNAVGSICAIQDANPDAVTHPLFYFPNLADTLSNLGAYQRVAWYGFNAMPTTAVCGKDRIYGLLASEYPGKYQSAVQSAKERRSFISSATSTLVESPNHESLTINIQVANANTKLYTSANLNPAINSRFFVGLFKKASIAHLERYVFSNWIAFADTINNTINHGSVYNKSYSMSLVNTTLAELQTNYRIYYWIQDKQGGIVYYANYSNFAVTSTEVEDYVITPLISAYPNPLRNGSDMKLSGLQLNTSISIYNLRGQCIWKGNANKDITTIPASVFTASGLYFVKSESADGQHKHTTKISVIK